MVIPITSITRIRQSRCRLVAIAAVLKALITVVNTRMALRSSIIADRVGDKEGDKVSQLSR